MNVDARFRIRNGRHRALTAFAMFLTAMAAAVAGMAFTVFSPAAGVVLDPEPAALTTDSGIPTTAGSARICRCRPRINDYVDDRGGAECTDDHTARTAHSSGKAHH